MQTYETELAHYGIKGQKWGIRRFQRKDGSLTPEGKKKYKSTRADEVVWGKRGAKRIAERRNKGDSRKTAVRKEFARKAVYTAAITAIGSASVYAYTSGNASKYLKSAKNIIDNYKNVSVLDAGGNVVAKYHDTVKVGEAVANSLLRKR